MRKNWESRFITAGLSYGQEHGTRLQRDRGTGAVQGKREDFSTRDSFSETVTETQRRRSRILVRGFQRSFGPKGGGPEPKMCSK